MSDEKKAWAEAVLLQKYQEIGRLPKKDDFDDVTVSRIKAFLGPWPRALEAAGLKETKVKVPKKKKKRKDRLKAQCGTGPCVKEKVE